MLTIQRRDEIKVSVLAFSGNLDALNAPSLKRECDTLVREERFFVVLDMAELALIDSSGVGAIVSLFKQVRTKGGDLQIAALGGQPREIFRLLRLDQAFELADDVDAALERLGP